MANRVSLRRLLFLVVLALGVSVAVVPGAAAGNFDEQRMGCMGEDPAICPKGTTGQAYTMPIELLGDEDEACAVYTVSSGNLPPGLAVHSDEAKITGTPTAAGRFQFYLNVAYTREASCPFKNPSDDQFVITIDQGAPVAPPLPRLIIGPESVSPGTVGTPYMAAMTANLPDSKTWSIVSGSLPPGLALGAGNGVIAGRPAGAGTYSFTVQARIADGRSDTKALTLEVRDRLTVTGAGDLETRVARTEVGVAFDGGLFATGGFGTYTWSVDGDLPLGLELADDGTISGRPAEAGTFRFTVSVTDAESRRALYAARLIVAKRLAIRSAILKPAKVGRFMSRKVFTIGGVGPMTTKLKRGPLPKGVFFDRLAGIFVGMPTKAGTWKIRVEVIDSLGVKATRVVRLVVRP